MMYLPMWTPEAPSMIRAMPFWVTLPFLPMPPAAKMGISFCLPWAHQVEIALADIGGDGMAGGVHADVVGGAGAAVDAVDHQAAGIGVAHQVVQHRFGRGGAGDLRIDRDPEVPGHGHGLDHLHDALLNGVEGLVHRRRGQIHALGHPAQPGDELGDLEPHQAGRRRRAWRPGRI